MRKALVELKAAMMEDEELRKKFNGAPLRTWARVFINALDLDPRAVQNVELAIESRLYVDKDKKAWCNEKFGKGLLE